MTVYKTFLKIVNNYKPTIILYIVILIAFAGFNLQTSENSTNFVANRPNVMIINKDKNEGITKNLIEYIANNSEIKDIENNEETINDALFYRDISYIIYIPENYRNDFLNGLNPKIEIKSTGDYEASLAEMMLSKYIQVANIYQESIKNEEEIISKINDTLSKKTKVDMISKLDTTGLEKASFYYNFLNYSILAGSVYVICLVLSSFREEKVRKRTIISSMNYKKYNRQLLISNGILAIGLWLFYTILSFILIGDIMFTIHGMMFILNSFIFSLCSLTMAFLIGTLLNNKNAINGIVNVVALGSSFLCGAFVPARWIPDTVLKVAHILPSYWYINSNDTIKTIETINFETIKPVLINMFVIVLFSAVFIILTNVISKKKKQ